MKILSLLVFTICFSCLGCVSKKKQESKENIKVNEEITKYNEEVSGVCVNILNQLTILENVKLVEYSDANGFVVQDGKEEIYLGYTCLLSSKNPVKEYKDLPKVSIRCMLDSYVLESSNYYLKVKNKELIEIYNPEYGKTYITHPKACSLVEEGDSNGK